MGLVDKIKSIFTEEVEDEEEEEVKVEQIKKEVRSVPIESPSVEKVPEKEEIEEVENSVSQSVESKTPIFFTDRDFEDLVAPKRTREERKQPEKIVPEEPKREETPKPYGGAYSSTSIVRQEKQNFKPTPIISPVYGVLDKNYHKEDIIDRKEPSSQESYTSMDGLSVDSIRNKAYGTLEDDLQDAMTPQPKVEQPIDNGMDLFDELEEKEQENTITEKENNIRELEEATVDLTKELDNLLLKKEKDKKLVPTETPEKEKEKDKGKKKKKEEEISSSDLFNLIDSMYEEGEEE